MPKTLHPYLNFSGRTEEAMKFYAEAIGGELELMRFGDSPMKHAPEHKDRVMHATLKVDGNVLMMASDTQPGQQAKNGDSVHLSLNFTDKAEQQRVWDKLSAKGTVTMPLSDQFFGRFGMFTDLFGINWMLHFGTMPSK